jgi:hypothetical protein
MTDEVLLGYERRGSLHVVATLRILQVLEDTPVISFYVRTATRKTT